MRGALDIVTFGRALVQSGDLDPVYVALHGAGLDERELTAWCVAYWCFYDAGTASALVDAAAAGGSFWRAARLGLAAAPRGRERRHFRGQQARDSVDWMAASFPDPGAVLARLQRSAPSVERVRREVLTWRGFGPWIAWKVADMTDRVLGVPLEWERARAWRFIFSEPEAGARMAAAAWGDQSMSTEQVMSRVQDGIRDLQAPPALDRPCGPAEVETVLCKWKSHRAGRYAVGSDTIDLRKHLASARGSVTAERLLACLPR